MTDDELIRRAELGEVIGDGRRQIELLVEQRNELQRMTKAIDEANLIGVYAVPQRWGREIWWLARTAKGRDIDFELLQKSANLGRYRTIQKALWYAAMDERRRANG